jgi:hypothetical protein
MPANLVSEHKETARDRYHEYVRTIADNCGPVAVWYVGKPTNRPAFERSMHKVLSAVGWSSVHVRYNGRHVYYLSSTAADQTIARWAIESRSVTLSAVHGVGPSETRLYRIGGYDWTRDVLLDHWLMTRTGPQRPHRGPQRPCKRSPMLVHANMDYCPYSAVQSYS